MYRRIVDWVEKSPWIRFCLGLCGAHQFRSTPDIGRSVVRSPSNDSQGGHLCDGFDHSFQVACQISAVEVLHEVVRHHFPEFSAN